MKIKKRFFRLFSALVICMMLVSAMCPAAFAYESLDYQFSFDFQVLKADFVSVGTVGNNVRYKQTVDLTDKLIQGDGIFVDLVFKGHYNSYPDSACKFLKRAEFQVYSVPGVGDYYWLGDPYLYLGSGESNECGYLISYNVTSPELSEIYVSPDFYSSLFVRASGPISSPGYYVKITGTVGDASDFVEPGITTSLGWVGQFITSLVSPGGELFGLLPMLAILFAVPALLLGIKVIRSIIWGS